MIIFTDDVVHLFSSESAVWLFVNQHSGSFVTPAQTVGFEQSELFIRGSLAHLYLKHVFQRLNYRFLAMHVAGDRLANPDNKFAAGFSV